MAASEYYVDPSINANSGGGTTTGDPYGDLQYALDQITRNTTDGDIIHIKAGTAEVFSAALSFATYGTPQNTAPLTFRGYSTTAYDDGIGEIDTNSYGLSQSFLHLVNLKISNATSGYVLTVGTGGSATNCWITNGNGTTGGIACSGQIYRCFVSDCDGQLILVNAGQVSGCYLKSGPTYTATYGLYQVNGNCFYNNIIHLGSTGQGMLVSDDGIRVESSTWIAESNNSTGIVFPGNKFGSTCFNNLVEGWTTGIDQGNGGEPNLVYGYNSFYDNTTDVATGVVPADLGNDESLGSSVIARTGTITDSDFVSDNAGFWAAVEAYYAASGSVSDGYGFGSYRGAVPPASGGGSVIVIED